MITAALWKNWVLSLLLFPSVFFAALRLADVLQGQFKHLLLPSRSASGRSAMYIKVDEPKSRRRGARKQHASTSDCTTIALWEFLAASKAADDLIYPFFATSFRKQWREIATLLQVQMYSLTQTRMRGGGAVFMYLNGITIADTQRRMRIQDQQTLRHYFQDVAANEILNQFPKKILDDVTFLSYLRDKLVLQRISGFASPS